MAMLREKKGKEGCGMREWMMMVGGIKGERVRDWACLGFCSHAVVFDIKKSVFLSSSCISGFVEQGEYYLNSKIYHRKSQ